MQSRLRSINYFFMLLLFMFIITPIISHAQEKTHEVNAKGIVLAPNEKTFNNIGTIFDYGQIQVHITINTSFSKGLLFYNLSNSQVQKEGKVTNKINFAFIYPDDGDIWYFIITNIGNKTIKFDLIMDQDNYVNPNDPIVIIFGLVLFVIIIIAIGVLYDKYKKLKQIQYQPPSNQSSIQPNSPLHQDPQYPIYQEPSENPPNGR